MIKILSATFTLRKTLLRIEVVGGFFLIFCAALAAADIINDIQLDIGFRHLAGEAVQSCVTFVLGIYLIRKSVLQAAMLRMFKSKLKETHKNAVAWKNSVASLKTEFVKAIDGQFIEWKLSAAEQHVAWLLIKGFSSAEIANFRNTSERTVRQQATAVYAKAGLEGRSQLAAFFLEDLLSENGVV
jgi:DNA-binding CsgD family transcriptional regulator